MVKALQELHPSGQSAIECWLRLKESQWVVVCDDGYAMLSPFQVAPPFF
jgi:hypothetical protein